MPAAARYFVLEKMDHQEGARDMANEEARTKILAFAAQVGRGQTQPAEEVAKRRNWLSAEGEVTEDGRALVAALDDQGSTRTVFRGNF
jgi:hypothetical protein